MSGEVFAIVDGMPKSLGFADSIIMELQKDFDESATHLVNGMASISLNMEIAAESFARLAKAFGLPRYMRLRRQAIAKARGKNWRNVR